MQTSGHNSIRTLLTILSILLIPFYSAAQNARCTISGHIADMQNVPVAYASVAVYDDARPIAGTITDNNGKFTLKITQNSEDYELAVEFIGYTRYNCKITPDRL